MLREQYPNEKATYHVSADIKNVPTAAQCTDVHLLKLFEQDDARQVLHVSFGKVLTVKNAGGAHIFKSRILDCLQRHEDIHYKNLQLHFKRHMTPFC